jgi:retinol dehydrogenase 12
MSTRYFDSKLLEILYGRALVSAISSSGKPLIALNLVNPGFCASELFRDPSAAFKLQLKVMGRTAEEGSRALVDAVGRGEDSHGAYLSDCKVAKVSDFVLSKKGAQTQQRVWDELNAKLEKIQPGVLDNV